MSFPNEEQGKFVTQSELEAFEQRLTKAIRDELRKRDDREYYTNDEICELEGISRGTLENRISARAKHPPFHGRGDSRRFPKDEYKKWARTKLVHARDGGKQAS